MQLNFRQGIVSVPTVVGAPNYLVVTGNRVDLNTTNRAAVFTLAHGTDEYLIEEKKLGTNNSAWLGPFGVGIQYFLYIGLDPATGQRIFGHSIVPPVVSVSAPVVKVNDLHWFNPLTATHQRWNGTRWEVVIRLFVASLSGTTILYNPINASLGGLNSKYNSGRVVYGYDGRAIRQRGGTFLTSADDVFFMGTNPASLRLETISYAATAAVPITKYTVVKLTSFSTIVPANYSDSSVAALAIVTENVAVGDQTNVSFSGVVSNPDWNWVTPGDKLFIDVAGTLTPNDPGALIPGTGSQPHVAVVLTPDTVYFAPTVGARGSDGKAGTFDVKESVIAATTLPIALLTPPATIDGITIVPGQRVLVKNQVTTAENGIYVLTPAMELVRSPDANTGVNLNAGAFVFIESGATHDNEGWIMTSDDPIAIGVSSIVWNQFTSVTDMNFGNGLIRTGTNVAVLTKDATSITVDATGIDLAPTGVLAGTYKSVTVDAKGRVTAGSSPVTLAGFGIADGVNKAGDTMTGALVLPGNPVLSLEAAPKQYVDTTIATALAASPLLTPLVVAGIATGSVADTFAIATHRGARYTIQASQGANHQMSELLVIHNGTSAFVTEFGNVASPSSFVTFDATVVGSNVLVTATTALTGVTVKFAKTTFAA